MTGLQHSIGDAFAFGYIERLGSDGTGRTYDDDPTSPRSDAYDRGRSLAELFLASDAPAAPHAEGDPAERRAHPDWAAQPGVLVGCDEPSCSACYIQPVVGETRRRGTVPVTVVGFLSPDVLVTEEPGDLPEPRRSTVTVREFMTWPLATSEPTPDVVGSFGEELADLVPGDDFCATCRQPISYIESDEGPDYWTHTYPDVPACPNLRIACADIALTLADLADVHSLDTRDHGNCGDLLENADPQPICTRPCGHASPWHVAHTADDAIAFYAWRYEPNGAYITESIDLTQGLVSIMNLPARDLTARP